MRSRNFFLSVLLLGSCQSINEKLTEALVGEKCNNWDIIKRENESGVSTYRIPVYRYNLCKDGSCNILKYNTETKIWQEAEQGDVITSNSWKMLSDSVVEIEGFQKWKIEKITSDTLIWSIVGNKKRKETMVGASSP